MKVYEEEKKAELELQKEKEEILKKTKKIVYPFYAIGGTLAAIFMFA